MNQSFDTWVGGPVFTAMLHETMQLMRLARDTVAWVEAHADEVDDTRVRVLQVIACSRVTSRLTAVLSWLLTQMAVQEGEIDPAMVNLRLYGVGDPRLEEDGEMIPLPARLTALLIDSGALFQRAARLEKLQCPD